MGRPRSSISMPAFWSLTRKAQSKMFSTVCVKLSGFMSRSIALMFDAPVRRVISSMRLARPRMRTAVASSPSLSLSTRICCDCVAGPYFCFLRRSAAATRAFFRASLPRPPCRKVRDGGPMKRAAAAWPSSCQSRLPMPSLPASARALRNLSRSKLTMPALRPSICFAVARARMPMLSMSSFASRVRSTCSKSLLFFSAYAWSTPTSAS
mmetsp:Transcript_450/g.1170  ORF Transcript_450/g.1170 Transcript_450/m.1170 type:complete len:209 (+) Transcript_450:1242-1868(+)